MGASVAALAGLSLYGAESRCQADQDAYHAQTRERPSGNEVSQFRSDRSGLPCLLESAIANPETQQTDQNETRDLMAQEASALWGYWLLVIAALQLIATIIGLVFIKRTLDATWKAVGDTCEATVAMKRQNELTERAFREASTTSRAQLRTYFSSLRESCEISDAGTAFKCIYQYKNVGLTPAHDTVISLNPAFISRGKPHSVGHRGLENKRIQYGMMGPGADNRVNFPVEINPTEAEAIKKAAGIVVIFITLHYRDEFGDRWEYTQNLLVEAESYNTGILYTSSCNTRRMPEAEAQKAEGELDLQGGHEGREA